MYPCFHCGEEAVVWGGDYSFEDYGLAGEGIVHNLECTACGAEIQYTVAINKEEE